MKSVGELGKHLNTLQNIVWSPHPSGLSVSPKMLLMALAMITALSNIYCDCPMC